MENDILSEIVQIMTENSEIDTYLRSAKDFAPNDQILPKLIEKFEDELKNFSKENILLALNLLTDRENGDGSHSERVQGMRNSIERHHLED